MVYPSRLPFCVARTIVDLVDRGGTRGRKRRTSLRTSLYFPGLPPTKFCITPRRISLYPSIPLARIFRAKEHRRRRESQRALNVISR